VRIITNFQEKLHSFDTQDIQVYSYDKYHLKNGRCSNHGTMLVTFHIYSAEIPIVEKYQRRLADWDQKASVRKSPPRYLCAEEAQGKLYFMPEVVPVSQHPALVARDLSATLLIEHLYTYLNFTTVLEHDVINAVAQQIAQGQLAVDLPQDMRIDAFKVYCDEGYHALFCAHLISQVEIITGIPFRPRALPPFLRHLRGLQSSVAQEFPQMAELCFAVVSETLIAQTLARTAKDARVVGAVRHIMADHAQDEARHYAYFSNVFEIIWPQLSPREQETVGPLLPQFILGFLEPDLLTLANLLALYGLPADTIQDVLDECYPAAQVLADAKAAAQTTLRLFTRCGVLEEPQTAEAFYASGLINAN
jgi:hypothetical protein